MPPLWSATRACPAVSGTPVVAVAGHDRDDGSRRTPYRFIGILFSLLLMLLAPVAQAAPTPTPTATAAELRAQAEVWQQEGLVLYNKKDMAGAVDKYGQALIAYVRLGDLPKEALLSNDIGTIANEMGKYPNALGFYERALPIWRQLGDRAGEATTLSNMALTNANLGQQEQATSLYQQAAAIRRDSGDANGAAAAFNAAGQIYYNQGKYSDALDTYKQALSMLQAGGDQEAQARTLWSLALASSALNQYTLTLDYYQQALTIYESLGDGPSQATTLTLLGFVYSTTGDGLKALHMYEEARNVQQSLGDRSGESMSTYSIALVNDGLGQRARAIAAYEQALAMYRELGNHASEAFVLVNLAYAQSSSGNYDQALDYLQQALAVQQSLADRKGEGEVTNSIGHIYLAQRNLDMALRFYTQATGIDHETGNTAEEGATLYNIGMIHYQKGEYEQARDAYERSLPLHRAANIPARVWITLNDLCLTYDALGDEDKALATCQESLQMQRQASDAAQPWLILSNIGYVYAQHNDLDRARDYYQQAIAAYEQTRAATKADELRASLAEQFSDVYARAIAVEMRSGQAQQAFDLSERARARSFLDQMGNTQLAGNKTANAQLLTQEQVLRAQMMAIESSLLDERAKPQAQAQADTVHYLANQISTKQREYSELLGLVRRTDPEYASLVSVDPLPLAEVQKLIANDTTLVSYYVTTDKTYAYVITRDSFQSIELAVSYNDLYAAIREFYDFASLDESPASLTQLYNWLVAPLRSILKTATVGIIPHSILHYVPFAALGDGQRTLGAEHLLFYLPNATSLQFIEQKRKSTQGRLLAMAYAQAEGLPTLQYASAEVESIARLYKTQPLLGSAASKAELVARAADYGIIHLAAHGQLNTANPLFSRIVLAAGSQDDGYLTVSDVYGLDLKKADLVVLSACQTQLGLLSRGDDVVGLTRAFIYAGSPSVISSLWSVDDQATGILMTSFYKHLKQGMGKAAALTAAQADTRARYPHPYYWAAFVLTGDPGKAQQTRGPVLLLSFLGLVVIGVCTVLLRGRHSWHRKGKSDQL